MLVNTISFKVRGVTFNNEEGKDIQKEIKRILKEYKDNDYFDKLYGGYTNKEIKEMDLNVSEYEGYYFPAKLVGDKYKGEDCIKIYFKTYNDEYVHIGYAPKEELKNISEWLSKENIKVEGKLNVVGGKYKYVDICEEDYEEEEKIVTSELTYGIEIELNFYDDKVDPEYQKHIEQKENLKKQQEKGENYGKIIGIIVVSICIIGAIWLISSFFSFVNNIFE